MSANLIRLFGRAGCKDSVDLRDFMQRSTVPFEWVGTQVRAFFHL